MSMRKRLWWGLGVWAMAGTACAVSPDPILIEQTATHRVDVRYDAWGHGDGHSHPARLTPDQLATVLQGIRIQPRDGVGIGGLFRDTSWRPALTPAQVAALAPPLSVALTKVSSVDLVSFLISTDGSRVTSGGVFIRQHHLYVILANAQSSSGGLQYEDVYVATSAIDPLQPIARFGYRLEFLPADWSVPIATAKARDGWRGYADESKVVVIDLHQLRGAPPPAGR